MLSPCRDRRLQETVQEKLRENGVDVSLAWTSFALEYLQTFGPFTSEIHKLTDYVFDLFLSSDLYCCGISPPVIPNNIHQLHRQKLFIGQKVILQIDEAINISSLRSSDGRGVRSQTNYNPKQAATRYASTEESIAINENNNIEEDGQEFGRVNKLLLTDGYTQVVGLDLSGILQQFTRQNATSNQQRGFAPGAKIAVKDVFIRRGVLMLTSSCACLLGGEVQRLSKHYQPSQHTANSIDNNPIHGNNTNNNRSITAIHESDQIDDNANIKSTVNIQSITTNQKTPLSTNHKDISNSARYITTESQMTIPIQDDDIDMSNYYKFNSSNNIDNNNNNNNINNNNSNNNSISNSSSIGIGGVASYREVHKDSRRSVQQVIPLFSLSPAVDDFYQLPEDDHAVNHAVNYAYEEYLQTERNSGQTLDRMEVAEDVEINNDVAVDVNVDDSEKLHVIDTVVNVDGAVDIDDEMLLQIDIDNIEQESLREPPKLTSDEKDFLLIDVTSPLTASQLLQSPRKDEPAISNNQNNILDDNKDEDDVHEVHQELVVEDCVNNDNDSSHHTSEVNLPQSLDHDGVEDLTAVRLLTIAEILADQQSRKSEEPAERYLLRGLAMRLLRFKLKHRNSSSSNISSSSSVRSRDDEYFFDVAVELDDGVTVYPAVISDTLCREYLATSARALRELKSRDVRAYEETMLRLKDFQGVFVAVWQQRSLLSEDRGFDSWLLLERFADRSEHANEFISKVAADMLKRNSH